MSYINNGKHSIEGNTGHNLQLFMEPHFSPHPTQLNATNPCIWSIRSCYGGGDDGCVNNNNINYYGINSIKNTIQFFLICFVVVILNFVKVVVRVLIIFAVYMVLSFG